MEVKVKNKVTTTITIEMEEWEARSLKKLLDRIEGKDHLHKSEFSLAEKVTGRKLRGHLVNNLD